MLTKISLAALAITVLLLTAACADDTINGSTPHAEQPELTSAPIVEFNFCFPSPMPDNYIEIVKDEGRIILRGMRITMSMEIDEEVLTALHELIAEHDIMSWNGFVETTPLMIYGQQLIESSSYESFLRTAPKYTRRETTCFPTGMKKPNKHCWTFSARS